MAEGFFREMAGARAVSLSAGSKPSGFVHRLAIRVMSEAGVDVSGHSSKDIRTFLPPDGTPPDRVVSVCGNAERECPVFPGAVDRLHWPFEDPADATGTEEEQLAVFRAVRDQIRERIAAGLDTLLSEPSV